MIVQSEGDRTSPGRPHTIRLYERQVTVRVSYTSPPKDDHQTKTSDIHLHNHKVLFSGGSCRAKKKPSKEMAGVKLDRKEKQFYKLDRGECLDINAGYELFQQNMLERKVNRRLKVYSSSKTEERHLTPSRNKAVPLKVITLRDIKPRPLHAKANSNGRISRVKREERSSILGPVVDKKAVGTIKLYDKQTKFPHGQMATEKRRKESKLEVTSVRRRKRQDSGDISGVSSSLRRENPNQSGGRQASGWVNSFNVSSWL